MSPATKTFLSPNGFTLGPLKFRNISFGDSDLAWSLGITLLGNPTDSAAPAVEVGKMEQIKRLMWLLHIPEGRTKDEAIDSILEAVDNDTWKNQSRRFGFALDMSALEAMTDRLNGKAEQIAEASVKVAEEEAQGDDGKKKAPSQTAVPA